MAFTFFFRDLQVLESAVSALIPVIAGRSRVRIWDAGCAYGPEPFSLAIVLAERLNKFAFRNIHITASDIDNEDDFQATIAKAEYSADGVSRLPKEILKRYFEPMGLGSSYKVLPLITDRINFVRHDLLNLKPIGEGYSMIICKNVLLHFSYEQRVKVISMFKNALAENGILVFEQTQEMPKELNEFFEKASGDSQVFRKKTCEPALKI